MSTGPQSLASVQRWMHEALVFPRRVAHEAIDGQLASFPGLSGAAGLAIYQRGYFLRIASCMREQFPALCHALGEPLFNDFVVEYIRERPPEGHTLYDLGRRFPAGSGQGDEIPSRGAARDPTGREEAFDQLGDGGLGRPDRVGRPSSGEGSAHSEREEDLGGGIGLAVAAGRALGQVAACASASSRE